MSLQSTVKNLAYVKGLTCKTSTVSMRSYSILCPPDAHFLLINESVLDTVYWLTLSIYFHPLLFFFFFIYITATGKLKTTFPRLSYQQDSGWIPATRHTCLRLQRQRNSFSYRGSSPHSLTQSQVHRCKAAGPSAVISSSPLGKQNRVLTLGTEPQTYELEAYLADFYSFRIIQ